MKRPIAILTLTGGLVAGVLQSATPASASVTTVPMTGRVSVSTNGLEVGSSGVDVNVFVESSGRYVYFSTPADLLDDALGLPDHDTNGLMDVYRRDRLTETTERISFAGSDTQINGSSHACGMSADGRYVAFISDGANLPGAGKSEVYVRDVNLEATTLGSVAYTGQPAPTIVGNQPCPVSNDGKIVAFVSSSNAVVLGDTNGEPDVFVHQSSPNVTIRGSVDQGGGQIDQQSLWPALSGDGSTIAFQTMDGAVVQGDLNSTWDVFVRKGGTTTRASVLPGGGDAKGSARFASLSTTGRYIAFASGAPGMTPDDDNGKEDVFRKDLQTGTVEAASVKTGTGDFGEFGSEGSTITGDGRYVGFTTGSKNLYPDPHSNVDAFRHDFTLDRTDLVSRVGDTIAPGNGASGLPRFSADGRVGGFTSYASDLVAGDLDSTSDAFVRDFALDIAPFGSAQKFMAQQYVDFLGLSADALPPGASRVITHGLHSPDHYLVLCAHGSTWAGKRAPLSRLYWAFFLRVPDEGGMDYWTKKLTNGTKLSKVASQFAASSEFKTKYGSLSNGVFVTKIYENIFSREPDPAGLAYWTKKLDTKTKTRGDVMVSFSESSEGQRVLAPVADAVLLHLGMLRTMPSTLYVQLLMGSQKGTWTPEKVAASLRTTDEYAARVSA